MERESEDLQQRLYYLVEQLQSMAQDLPPKYQQRLPYELLSGLAHSLLNETVFEIVKGLMDIQHVTEKHLFQQRLQLLNRQKMEKQELLQKHRNSASRGDLKQQQALLLQCEADRQALERKHQSELKQSDMKRILELDQKVSDQQVTLEKAGVPGFYVTNNPAEVQVQMHLLDFVLRLGHHSGQPRG